MDTAAATGAVPEAHSTRIWSDAEGESHLEDLRRPGRHRRTLPVGGAVLAENTEGRGHLTRHPPGDQRVLVVPLAPDGT